MKIYLFHGFLGLPSDWHLWQKQLSKLGYQAEAVNLWSYLKNGPLSFQEFAAQFKAKYLDKPALIFGYSMGGRLALEVAKFYPDFISSLILFSTQITSPVSQSEREIWQSSWSEKWRTLPWDEVVAKWNDQEVFSGSKEIERREEEFDRQALVDSLNCWSISLQNWNDENFPSQPIKWICGELDKRMDCSRELISSFSGDVERIELPRVGHRVIFEIEEVGINRLLRKLLDGIS